MNNIEKIEKTEIRVDDALTLCYIYYLFDMFNSNLIKFLNKQKNKIQLINDLSKYSQNKNYNCNRNIKKFYNKNKQTIDIINKHSEISKFIYSNYRIGEIITYGQSILNEYLKKNEYILFKIIRVLDRIKELGFHSIEFNEDLNFTKEIYIIFAEDYKNYRLNYLENIEIIPIVHEDEIIYRTKASNYKVISTTNGNRIILNNLTFDASCLPESVSTEYIQEQILKLGEATKVKTTDNYEISNLSIEQLYLILDKLNKQLDDLSNLENRKKIFDKIIKVKQKIEELTKENKQIIFNSKMCSFSDENKKDTKTLKLIKQ